MNPFSPPSRIPTFRPVNRYDRLEWAGTFGDMGTLMPFVIAYVSVLRLDPFSALFGFGVSMKVVGWFYRTPFPGRPMQPLKAAGAVATTQAAQSALITPGSVNGASLIWLLLAPPALHSARPAGSVDPWRRASCLA